MKPTILAMLAALAGSASGDVVHFANGDRLSGSLAEASDRVLEIDVAQVGVVRVPCTLVARVESEQPTAWCAEEGEPAATSSSDGGEGANGQPASPPSILARTIAEWNLQSDLALAVASGNTRTRDFGLVIGADRTGQRFDNVIGVSIHKAKARIGSDDDLARTKDQLDLDYDLRWKVGDSWYTVANFEYYRDPIKDIERRVTTGLGAGIVLQQSPLGSLSMDAGVSQVVQRVASNDGLQDPALRWNLRFNRWLIANRLEAFHNNQWLHILNDGRGAVWDSDTGIRLRLNDRWQAGLRVDLQYESEPPAGRAKTDASYALALGVRL